MRSGAQAGIDHIRGTEAGDVPPSRRLDLLGPEVAKDPYAVYRRLLTDAPVCQVNPGGLWAISRYRDVRHALKHPEIFSSVNCHNLLQPEWLQSDFIRNYGLLFEDPPQHTPSRRLANKLFSRPALERIQPLMRQTAQALVDGIEAGERFDFAASVARPYADRVMGYFTGIDDPHCLALFRRWATLIESPPHTPDAGYGETVAEATRDLSQMLSGHIQKRRACPHADMVSELLQPPGAGNQPPADHVIGQLLELVVAGGMQPIPYLLVAALLQLAGDPPLLAALRQQPALLSPFVDELLRHASPTHYTVRRTRTAITVSATPLPAGAPVVLILAAANRDPAQFDNPDTFNPWRARLKTHLAFGNGVHRCVGATLTKLEMVAILEALLSRFRQIDCPARDELAWVHGLFSYGVRELPVRFYP